MGNDVGLVGRAAETSELGRAIGDTLAGRGNLVVITGEPGIGKSRLAQEARLQMHESGGEALWGTGWEGGGAPAYWPWIKVIRAHAARQNPVRLAEELGPGAPDILPLVPDLSDRLGKVSSPSPGPGGEQARFRLFDAVASFFRRASEATPLLVVLDDLQWADDGSLRMLQFCSQELRDARVLLVAVLRDIEVDPSSATARLLGDLQSNARVLSVSGLDESDVQLLLSADLSVEEAARLAPAVHRRSGGNPLFVRELGRLIAGRRTGSKEVDPPVPQTIRAVIGRWLARLSADCLDVLRIAAAIGEEFHIPVLTQVAGITRDKALALLDEALATGLVRASSSDAQAFDFTHALVRDELYGGLPLAARVNVHGRIGDALVETGAVVGSPAEVAHHFLLGGRPEATHYAETAAQRSLEQLAYEDAANHFARAIHALELTTLDEDRRMYLLLRSGEALLDSGDVDAGRKAFEEAAGLARSHGNAEALTQAALGFAAGLAGFEVRLLDRAQVDLLEEALRSLPDEDSALRVWTMSRLSVALTSADADDRRRTLCEESIAMARRVGEPSALAHALAAHCDAFAGPKYTELRIAEASEIVRLSVDANDRATELLGRRHSLMASLEAGRIREVDAEIEAFESTARTLRQPIYLAYVPVWRGMRALMEGRLRECSERIEEASRLAAKAQSRNGEILSKIQRYGLMWMQGRMEETAEAARAAIELVVGPYGDSFWPAVIAAEQFPAEARIVIDRLSAGDFAELPRDATLIAGLCTFAEASWVLQHESGAERAYSHLLPFRANFVVNGTAAICFGSVERYLALCAAVLGRRDDAAAHFAEALAANRRAGATMLIAETLRQYGTTLVHLGEPEQATPLLQEALQIYGEVGCEQRVKQIEALIDHSATNTTPTRASDAVNVFRREGDTWTLSYERESSRLQDAKGLRDLYVLIAAQGREVHVTEVFWGPNAPARDAPASAPVIDEAAKAAYRERLETLREELDEAQSFDDTGRSAKIRAEIDVLTNELTGAFGLGGRARRLGDPVERARKAVAQRVANALKRIEAVHPALFRHLDRSIQMGTFCSYSPERPVKWKL